jgi:hypothetical protein
VIPTLMLVGLVLGRWWRFVIPGAAAGWAALLLATGIDSGLVFAASAASVAAVNVTIGVLVFQCVRALVRHLLGRGWHATER